MRFAVNAYAKGISNEAAGSEIEVLVDTIDATIAALDPEEEEFDLISLAELRDRWAALRSELATHPLNQELFGGEVEVDPLGDPPAKLADAWARYQRGDHVEPYELRALNEWRTDMAEEAGY